LSRGARLTELLKQPQYTPITNEMQVCVIYAGVNGYLDAVDVADVQRFEEGLIHEVNASGQEVLKAIRDTGQLDEATEGKLKSLVENYANAFA
jgi:F-type H+-transporting ATPase subunit alpha